MEYLTFSSLKSALTFSHPFTVMSVLVVWQISTESTLTGVPRMTGSLRHQTVPLKVQTPQEPHICIFCKCLQKFHTEVAAQYPSKITTIFDDSTVDDLHPMPAFRANVPRRVAFMQRGRQ